MIPGPYIVTTKRRSPADTIERDRNPYDVLSRVAVATLEKARDVAHEQMTDLRTASHGKGGEWIDYFHEVTDMPESGITITLPDGTVIEVEPTTWRDLLPDRLTGESLARLRWAERGDVRAQQHILDAFNTQEAKR
jgi:hypothetical protein